MIVMSMFLGWDLECEWGFFWKGDLDLVLVLTKKLKRFLIYLCIIIEPLFATKYLDFI